MNCITADILSIEKGSEHFEDIKAVRIVSEQYNLLIMLDYMPLIGEIKGNLSLINMNDESVEYENITGFYRHSKNRFECLLTGTK